MRRQIVAIFMIAGLLLQAYAAVRHASMLTSASLAASITSGSEHTASLAERTLAADIIASICLPEGGPGSSLLPPGPSKGDVSGCPICTGLVSAFALAPCLEQIGTIARTDGVLVFAPFDERVARHAFLRPQSRGPPSLG